MQSCPKCGESLEEGFVIDYTYFFLCWPAKSDSQKRNCHRRQQLDYVNRSAETKICPLCAETIKTAAKVCPFCRSKQGRYEMWRQELTIAGFGLALVAMAFVPVVLLAPEEKGVGGRSFAGRRDDLIVLETSWARVNAKNDFCLTGVVTNRSEHPWRVHELELRFLDAQGQLLDVRHHSVKEPFVVLSHREHGFRAQIGELAFTNSNVAHQVRVQEATDGDRPLKPAE